MNLENESQSSDLEWTGERFMPDVGVQIAFEHYSRYQFVREFAVGKAVLDCPSGEGFGSEMLSACASSVVGIDISEISVAHARKKYIRPNLSFECSSMAELHQIADGTIDLVVCMEGIEHVSAEVQRLALSEFARVLKADGQLIISTPNKRVYSDIPKFKNEFHIHEFYLDEFRSFLATRFPYMALFGQSLVNSCLIKNLDCEGRLQVKYAAFESVSRPDSKVSTLIDIWPYFIAVCSKADLRQNLDGFELLDFGQLVIEERMGDYNRNLKAHKESIESLESQVRALTCDLDLHRARLTRFENLPLLRFLIKLRRWIFSKWG